MQYTIKLNGDDPRSRDIDQVGDDIFAILSNDNDYLASFNGQDNPNQFFVFAFDDADLPEFVPQRFVEHGDHGDHRGDRDDRDR